MVHRSTSGESGSKANKYTLTENLRKHIEDVSDCMINDILYVGFVCI